MNAMTNDTNIQYNAANIEVDVNEVHGDTRWLYCVECPQ